MYISIRRWVNITMLEFNIIYKNVTQLITKYYLYPPYHLNVSKFVNS
jgi:hypothetical protein